MHLNMMASINPCVMCNNTKICSNFVSKFYNVLFILAKFIPESLFIAKICQLYLMIFGRTKITFWHIFSRIIDRKVFFQYFSYFRFSKQNKTIMYSIFVERLNIFFTAINENLSWKVCSVQKHIFSFFLSFISCISR